MPGRYKTATRAQEAERLYPVRIRIKVPPDGLRRTDTEMREWLTERLGGNYGTSTRVLGLDHFMFLHLPTAEVAMGFLEAFRGRVEIDLEDK